MPKLEESLIDKLTPRPEVREKARALLRTVHSKTGPGTGHDIGEAKIGLPAICAYIASKRYARCFSTRFFSLPSVHRVKPCQCGIRGRYRRRRPEGVLPKTQDVCEHAQDNQGCPQGPDDAS